MLESLNRQPDQSQSANISSQCLPEEIALMVIMVEFREFSRDQSLFVWTLNANQCDLKFKTNPSMLYLEGDLIWDSHLILDFFFF